MRVSFNINSVRHWLSVCRGRSPDDPSLTSEMVQQMKAADIDPFFGPMRFLGRKRRRNGAYVVSRLAKDRSPEFVFEVDAPNDVPVSHWALAQIEAFIAQARS